MQQVQIARNASKGKTRKRFAKHAQKGKPQRFATPTHKSRVYEGTANVITGIRKDGRPARESLGERLGRIKRPHNLPRDREHD